MRRTKEIKVRMTEEEFDRVTALAQATVLSREAFIREALRGTTIRASPPAEYVEILTSTLAEVTVAEREQCIANEDELLAAFEAEGVVFNEFDAESKAQINEMFAAYWTDKIAPIGDEAVAMLNTIIEAKA